MIQVQDDADRDTRAKPLSRLLFRGDIESFIQFLEKAARALVFMLVATRSGELVDCRGLIHGGRSSMARNRRAVLERESEIREPRAKSIEVERKAL